MNIKYKTSSYVLFFLLMLTDPPRIKIFWL